MNNNQRLIELTISQFVVTPAIYRNDTKLHNGNKSDKSLNHFPLHYITQVSA